MKGLSAHKPFMLFLDTGDITYAKIILEKHIGGFRYGESDFYIA